MGLADRNAHTDRVQHGRLDRHLVVLPGTRPKHRARFGAAIGRWPPTSPSGRRRLRPERACSRSRSLSIATLTIASVSEPIRPGRSQRRRRDGLRGMRHPRHASRPAAADDKRRPALVVHRLRLVAVLHVEARGLHCAALSAPTARRNGPGVAARVREHQRSAAALASTSWLPCTIGRDVSDRTDVAACRQCRRPELRAFQREACAVSEKRGLVARSCSAAALGARLALETLGRHAVKATAPGRPSNWTFSGLVKQTRVESARWMRRRLDCGT
jgi:hypothetical protein